MSRILSKRQTRRRVGRGPATCRETSFSCCLLHGGGKHLLALIALVLSNMSTEPLLAVIGRQPGDPGHRFYRSGWIREGSCAREMLKRGRAHPQEHAHPCRVGGGTEKMRFLRAAGTVLCCFLSTLQGRSGTHSALLESPMTAIFRFTSPAFECLPSRHACSHADGCWLPLDHLSRHASRLLSSPNYIYHRIGACPRTPEHVARNTSMEWDAHKSPLLHSCNKSGRKAHRHLILSARASLKPIRCDCQVASTSAAPRPFQCGPSRVPSAAPAIHCTNISEGLSGCLMLHGLTRSNHHRTVHPAAMFVCIRCHAG